LVARLITRHYVCQACVCAGYGSYHSCLADAVALSSWKLINRRQNRKQRRVVRMTFLFSV